MVVRSFQLRFPSGVVVGLKRQTSNRRLKSCLRSWTRVLVIGRPNGLPWRQSTVKKIIGWFSHLNNWMTATRPLVWWLGSFPLRFPSGVVLDLKCQTNNRRLNSVSGFKLQYWWLVGLMAYCKVKTRLKENNWMLCHLKLCEACCFIVIIYGYLLGSVTESFHLCWVSVCILVFLFF